MARRATIKTQASHRWMPLDRSLAERLRQHKAMLAPAGGIGRLGIREPGNRKTILARPNTGELVSPRCSEGGDRPDRLAHVQTQSFNIASCGYRRRSQGAAGTFATCGHSNNHEYLHASGSKCIARGEQQSSSPSASSSGCLVLMALAPRGPSQLYK